MATPVVSRPRMKRIKTAPTWSAGSTPALTPHHKNGFAQAGQASHVVREGSSSPESALGVPTPDRGFYFPPPNAMALPPDPTYYHAATPQKTPSSISLATPGMSPPSVLPFYAMPMQASSMANLGMVPMGMPMGMSPPSAIHYAGPGSPFKRLTADKDGDVWPPDLQAAFDAALRIVPRLGRRKILVHTATGAKPYGRNELIADYIRRHTGQLRSRKQVSSHIQVLKNVHKNNPAWMRLVGEPDDGDPDTFSDTQAAQFGGQMVAGVLHMLHGEVLPSPEASPVALRRSPSSHTGIPLPMQLYPHGADLQGGFLSAPHHAMLRSLSASSASSTSPEPMGLSALEGLSAADAFGSLNPAAGILSFGSGAEPMRRAESLASLSGGMQAMDVRSASGTGSSSPSPPPTTCSSIPERRVFGPVSGLSTAPTGFMMWANNKDGPGDEEGDTEEQFVFATLNEGEDDGSVVYLEDVDYNPDRRFPGLVHALSTLSCPMVHAKISLRLPSTELDCNADASAIQSQLNITTEIPPTDHGLAVVTTVFSDGRAELSFPPVSLGQPAKIGECTWMYSSMLPDAFLGQILKGENVKKNAIVQETMAGVRLVKNALAETTILQEYIVRKKKTKKQSSDPLVLGGPDPMTRGAKEGEVVLMIAFELCASDDEGSGKVKLSHLATRMPRMTALSAPPLLDVLHDFASVSSTSAMATTAIKTSSSPTSQSFAGEVSHLKRRVSTTPGSNRKRKNLSISIPAPPLMLGMGSASHADGTLTGGLQTPSFQIVHTPTVAPGAPGPGDAASVRRLQQSWAAAAGPRALQSPALYGPGTYPHLNPLLGQPGSGLSQDASGDVQEALEFAGILDEGTKAVAADPGSAGFLQAPTHGPPTMYPLGYAAHNPLANSALGHMFALTASAQSPTGPLPSLAPHGPSTPFTIHPSPMSCGMPMAAPISTSMPDGIPVSGISYSGANPESYWYGASENPLAQPIEGFFQGLWAEA